MIKKLLILALLVAPMSLCAQKVAHINYAEIVQLLPEFKTAQTELETLGKKYQAELEDMQKELQTKAQKYEAEDNKSTPPNIVERHNKELQEMQQKLEQAYNDNSKAFTEAQQQKLSPIERKVKDAAGVIAKESGYAFILDDNMIEQSNIVINPSLVDDITARVKAKLGL
ncbi:MAG: OmpH family outer membrane protein [Alloprevotella sp.]|nr:OmpH family outer membrane protein [Alloprevotella sp.]MBR6338635.1 OmpH family outer membrane protein [Alloprevotella sp.]